MDREEKLEKETDIILKRPPQSGDGTLHEERDERHANWFGPSLEPQEEFIDDLPERPEPVDVASDPYVGTGPENLRPSELPCDTPTVPSAEVPGKYVPSTPTDIFPYGDPGEQTDG